MEIIFSKRTSVEEVEEGKSFQPKFDENGLIPVITIDYEDNQVLMHGYMNEEALKASIETKKSHYWSRSRKKIWKKKTRPYLSSKVREAQGSAAESTAACTRLEKAFLRKGAVAKSAESSLPGLKDSIGDRPNHSDL